MIPTRSIPLAIATALALCGAAAHAQADDAARAQKSAARLQERFAAADANHDGRLTRDEARAMPMVHKHFEEIDSAHGGSVSMTDIQAYARARRNARDMPKPAT